MDTIRCIPTGYLRGGFDSMGFEYDPEKSAANLIKHGIDFEEAQELFEDPRAIRLNARTKGEKRYLYIGMIDGKLWTAVITYRWLNIRIISVRRARKEKRALYEQDN